VKVSAFEELGPFSDEPIDDAPLANAPLVRVLTQLRFPAAIAALRYSDGTAIIGRLVQPLTDLGYPLLEEGQQFGIQITPEGVSQVPGEKLWSFRSADGSWQMTLSPEFISLHTGVYGGRDDFVKRTKKALEVLAPVVGEVGVSRVGFRYINQLQSVPPEEMLMLIRPALHGGLAALRS
jgi:uncharacterized protein (TIGR04255 family)